MARAISGAWRIRGLWVVGWVGGGRPLVMMFRTAVWKVDGGVRRWVGGALGDVLGGRPEDGV